MGPEANLRGRLGEDRKARGAGELGDRRRRRGVGQAAGEDQPAAATRGSARRAPRPARRRAGRRRWHGRQRQSAGPALERQRGGGRHLAGARLGPERVPPGDVQVHRARARVAGGGPVGAAGDRAEMQQAGVVGVVGADLAEPSHRRAVELQLVDRLPGADPAQLRRPVGGEHDQADRRFVGLADGGVEVRGGGAGGAEDGRRASASPVRRRARRTRPSARRRVTRASIDGSRQSASASGVDRDPGLITASRTPQRASSETIAEASAVLRLVGSTAVPNARAGARPAHPRRARRRGRGRPAGQQVPVAELAGRAGDRLREEQLGREPVREAVGRALEAAAPAQRARRRRSRPGRRARSRGRSAAARRSRSPRRSRRPWTASPSPGRRPGRAWPARRP